MLVLITFWSFGFLGLITGNCSDCANAMDSANETYSLARKAYRSDDIAELRAYIKKLRTVAETAERSSIQCKCGSAEGNAYDVVRYAKKALDEDDFDEAVTLSKKSMRAAEDLISSLEDCSSNIDRSP